LPIIEETTTGEGASDNLIDGVDTGGMDFKICENVDDALTEVGCYGRHQKIVNTI